MQSYSKYCNYAIRPVFLNTHKICNPDSNMKLLSSARLNGETWSAGLFCICYTSIASLTAAIGPD